ncbi:hypothetical protein DFS34DRAFT_651297 [Phlyctochytrium arcticum]|nr:hypothetical protein DFS34DRAFT_654125 [Phlyctochytrium arcticum]KAI9095495.1 hypothetical protein DFS34DRAFT_651297 [Phlyctochytrium arcticum]
MSCTSKTARFQAYDFVSTLSAAATLPPQTDDFWKNLIQHIGQNPNLYTERVSCSCPRSRTTILDLDHLASDIQGSIQHRVTGLDLSKAGPIFMNAAARLIASAHNLPIARVESRTKGEKTRAVFHWDFAQDAVNFTKSFVERKKYGKAEKFFQTNPWIGGPEAQNQGNPSATSTASAPSGSLIRTTPTTASNLAITPAATAVLLKAKYPHVEEWRLASLADSMHTVGREAAKDVFKTIFGGDV